MVTPRITLLVEVSRDGIHYTVDGDDVMLDVIELDCSMSPMAVREPGEPWGTRRWPAVAVDARRVAEAGGPPLRVAVPAVLATTPATAAPEDAGVLNPDYLDAESMD
jgi:hypothetical protein